jgi:hypothetical protein
VPTSPKRSFLFMFFAKILYEFLICPMRTTCLVHLILLDLMVLLCEILVSLL